MGETCKAVLLTTVYELADIATLLMAVAGTVGKKLTRALQRVFLECLTGGEM